jgi:hypothetical protein
MRTSWRIVTLLAVGLVSSGCSGQSGTPTPQAPPPASRGPATGPERAEASWSLDPAGLHYPDRPAAGRVHGQDFTPDRVRLEGGVLTLRQGKEFFADREVKVFLFVDPESLAQGLHLEVRPDVEIGAQVPHVHLGWQEGGGLPKTDMFTSKYAMKLDLDKAQGSKLPGKIYVCLPDAAHSFLAGSFTAEAPDLVGTKVHGRVALKGAGKYRLGAGYVGSTATGDLKSGYSGTAEALDKGGSVSSFGSQLAFDDKGICTFRHLGVPPGTYLVFVNWNEHALDWKWVEVRDQKDLAVNLTVDTEGLGTLEVQLPAKSKERKVRLLPLDAAGKLPALKAPADTVAFQLQAYVKGLGAEAKADQDRVSFSGLKAGAYRVFVGPASADATVKPGQTAKVEVSAKP